MAVSLKDFGNSVCSLQVKRMKKGMHYKKCKLKIISDKVLSKVLRSNIGTMKNYGVHRLAFSAC